MVSHSYVWGKHEVASEVCHSCPGQAKTLIDISHDFVRRYPQTLQFHGLV
jgi:hypothetical protein